EHRDLFKADPEHYAPQFGNFCAMALALNQVVVANPENWLISDGKLYVFGKAAPGGPALFQKDLAANIAKANEHRPILPSSNGQRAWPASSVKRPALRKPSRKCSRSTELRNLVPNSLASKAGSTRRIIVTTLAASPVRFCSA